MKLKKIVLMILTAVLVFSAAASAEVLFEDNFDSYAAMTANAPLKTLNSSWLSPWPLEETNSEMKVGSLWPGMAYYSQNDSTDTALRIYRAVLPAGDLADYTVSVDVFDHPDYHANWYAAGRVTDTTYILAGAVVGNANPETGDRPLYTKIQDSDGNYLGDYWTAIYDINEPVNITLTTAGDQATVRVEHRGFTQELTMTTTVLNAGKPGFGCQWSWGYSKAYFDNFVVTATNLQGDINGDWSVDLLDLAVIASDWLKCTEPGNSNCIQY